MIQAKQTEAWCGPPLIIYLFPNRTISLDHFIGPIQNGRRNRDPERLGGLKIDDQFKLGWPFHREIARLGQPERGTRKPRLDSVLLDMVAMIFVREYEIRYHLGNARNSLDQRDDICFRYELREDS